MSSGLTLSGRGIEILAQPTRTSSNKRTTARTFTSDSRGLIPFDSQNFAASQPPPGIINRSITPLTTTIGLQGAVFPSVYAP